MNKPDIVVNGNYILGKNRKTINMTDWNGLPVEKAYKDGWIEELLAKDPPRKGEYSCIMSGDSMVLVLWDNLHQEWEVYDMQINRVGRAK
jgi:hypothetical protein